MAGKARLLLTLVVAIGLLMAAFKRIMTKQENPPAVATDLLRHRLGVEINLRESLRKLSSGSGINVETAQIIADSWFYKLAHYRVRVANDRSWLERL